MSKSKLASVNKKSKSIPQLELQAALIASRLKQKKYKGIQNTNKRNICVDRFKNSLHYLQNEDRNFRIYVSHRF